MAYLNRLLIEGTAIASLPGVSHVGAIDGLFSPWVLRDTFETIPTADGDLAAPAPLDKYLISVNVTVRGTSVANLNSNLRAIRPLITGDGGLVTLTRELDNGAGVTTYTASGRFAANTLQLVGGASTLAAQGDLQWYNLSGAWWDGSAWVS